MANRQHAISSGRTLSQASTDSSGLSNSGHDDSELQLPPEYMRPNNLAPFPLDANVFDKFISSDSARASSVTAPSTPNRLGSVLARVVSQDENEDLASRLVRENKDLIENEALRQVANEAITVRGAQYGRLISLEFDEEKLCREIEEQRQKKRSKALANRERIQGSS